MKSIVIAAFFTLMAGSLSLSSADKAGGGSIVIEDDIVMIVDSGDPGEDVTEVGIYESGFLDGEPVSTLETCDVPVCTLDVSHLSAGIYWVEAETEFSNTITDYIVIN